MPADRILLVGMMASGKSSVGPALADRLGWPYYDNDALLVASTSSTAAEILERDGEPALRAAESAVFRDLLLRPTPCVISVAAGVILDPADRGVLRTSGFVVWLRARIETLAARVGPHSDRPWTSDGGGSTLDAFAAERAPLYREVAALTVDTDEATPAAVCDQIIAARADQG